MLYSNVEKISNTYQCDKKASCGCGQTYVHLTVSGVIDAEAAVEHSWPMVVSIRYEDKHLCAGTVLSESFILTAADCVYLTVGEPHMNIVAGINTLSESITIRRKIDQIHIHPNYSPFQTVHDIAVVHLSEPLPLNSASTIVTNTCVPDDSKSLNNDYPNLNSSLAMVGWGQFGSSNAPSDVLQQMSIKILGDNEGCPSYLFNKTYEFCGSVVDNIVNKNLKYLCNGKEN